MRFLRDRELHGQLLLLLPMTLAAAGLGFSRAPQAGCLALGLCAVFALVLLWSAWRRYRTMEALCQDLDRILHGDASVNLDAYDEGAWSILHSQLTKLLIRLREQTDQLQGDKDQMAAFLADVSHQIRTPPGGPCPPSGLPPGHSHGAARPDLPGPGGGPGRL